MPGHQHGKSIKKADEVIGNEPLALFASFGSFAALVFADFAGPLPRRFAAYLGLLGAGAFLVAIGTLLSNTTIAAALVMAAVAFVAVFLGVLVSQAMPLFKAVQKKTDRINQVMRETLSGVRVIRAFVRDDFEQRRFEQANADLTGTDFPIYPNKRSGRRRRTRRKRATQDTLVG